MTPVSYTVRDIVEAAIEKEKKRRDFYATVTELSANPDMKGLFHYLSEQESSHVAAFIQIRNGLDKGIGTEEYKKDTDRYLDSILDDRLYSKIDTKEFVQKAIDTWNVFRLAIGFEKDSILCFTEFLPHLSESDRKIVEDLIEQEKGHIRKLVEVMEQIGD